MTVPVLSLIDDAVAAETSAISPAVTVAAIGAVATFAVGILNYRWQRKHQGRQLELLTSGHVTDRFTRAVEQLSSDCLPVRVGGIYALERIAREYPDDTAYIADILAAFVRDAVPSREGSGGYVAELGRRAPDAQAALTVLTRQPLCDERVRSGPAARGMLDLSRTDLRRAALANVRLDGANLYAARLEGADLRGAHLRYSTLDEANLGLVDPGSGKFTRGADLTGADLTGASLEAVHNRTQAVGLPEQTEGPS